MTFDPVSDAQDHIHRQDQIPPDYKYTCDSCNEGFDSGHGKKTINDFKFCDQCIAENKYRLFLINDVGLSAEIVNGPIRLMQL